MNRFTTPISFTVPKGTKAMLKALAAEQGVSMSELIRQITSEEQFAALTK